MADIVDDDENFGFGEFPYSTFSASWTMKGRECSGTDGLKNGYVGISQDFQNDAILLRTCNIECDQGWNTIMGKEDILALMQMLGKVYVNMK